VPKFHPVNKVQCCSNSPSLPEIFADENDWCVCFVIFVRIIPVGEVEPVIVVHFKLVVVCMVPNVIVRHEVQHMNPSRITAAFPQVNKLLVVLAARGPEHKMQCVH